MTYRSTLFRLIGGVLTAAAIHAAPAAAQGPSFASYSEADRAAPRLRAPSDPAGARVYQAAMKAQGKRLLVSVDERWLWLLSGRDTLLSIPVAVGMNQDFVYDGKSFRFETPRGIRKVRGKAENPVWTPPDWHYYEKAVRQGLTPVQLVDGDYFELSDGRAIEVRDNVVGRINEFGNWMPWTPGMEMIFDGMIFIPPMQSPQRRVPDALGPRKLDMGDGYLLHGTHLYNSESIGQAVSHGCVRLPNDYLVILYDLVPVGTPVYIF